MTWEENVRKVVPYVPGEQPQLKDIIKLNTNECPYPPAPGVERLLKEMPYEDLRLYPAFPEKTDLADALARKYNMDTDNIFIGVGSDDVLSMSFLTLFNSGKKIVFPDITYSFYDVWADVYGIPYEQIPLDENFGVCTKDYIPVSMGGNLDYEIGGIVIPNPNAPTSIFKEVSELEMIIKAHPECVVIIDEAYIDFGGESCADLIHKYDNLLVVQTFSKSRSMAGSRIGYAFGCKKLIKYINDVKYSVNSYTLNRQSLAVGAEAVRDDAYFTDVCQKVIATRQRIAPKLEELGFMVLPSKANFFFAAHQNKSGKEIFEALKERGIYVRHWDKDRISDFLRITIGTDKQMDVLIENLKEILN